MLPEKTELEKILLGLEKCDSDVSCEVSELMNRIASDQYFELMSMYNNNDLMGLREQLNEYRLIRKKFKQQLDSYPNQTVVFAEQFVQTYNIFNKLVQIKRKSLNFSEDLFAVLQKYSESKSIIMYMYKYQVVEVKSLVVALEININILNSIIEELENIHCVIKIPLLNHTVFELSDEARQYVKKNFKNCIEPIVDMEIVEKFRESINIPELNESKEILNDEKANYDMFAYSDEKRKNITGVFGRTFNENKCSNRKHVSQKENEWSEKYERNGKIVDGVR